MSEQIELDLLSIFTTRIRVASFCQLQSADQRWTQRLLHRLVERRLLGSTRLVVAVLDASGEPYARWEPQQPAPDSGAISYLGRKRVCETPRQSVDIFWATEHAANIVGGIGGKLRQPWQVQHDLGVSSVYLHFLRVASDEASQWISEDIYRRDYISDASEKIADAFLVNDSGDVQRAIELVGNYSAARLRNFHQFWSARRIAYEWR